MANEHSSVQWHIVNVDREIATGKVINVHYALDLTDGTHNAVASGSVIVSGDVTVPFKDLTEATVISWVKAQLGDAEVQELNAALEAQLEQQRAPKTAAGLPWG